MFTLVVSLVVMTGMQAQAPPPPQDVKPAAPVTRPAPPPRKLYNETADAKSVIENAVKAAADDDIRVVVNWGANDDERCNAFTAATRSEEITKASYFSDEYKLVYVDVGHLDRNLDLAASYGVKLETGSLPYLLVLDRNGKVLDRASAADLSTSGAPGLDSKKLAALLAKNRAPAPEAEPAFKAAVSQAKKDGKYAFVWFSAPW